MGKGCQVGQRRHGCCCEETCAGSWWLEVLVHYWYCCFGAARHTACFPPKLVLRDERWRSGWSPSSCWSLFMPLGDPSEAPPAMNLLCSQLGRWLLRRKGCSRSVSKGCLSLFALRRRALRNKGGKQARVVAMPRALHLLAAPAAFFCTNFDD